MASSSFSEGGMKHTTDTQKQFATLRAQFSRAGHVVHKGSNFDFTVVHRSWGMSRYCQDFAALQRFARQLGVTHG